MVKQLNLSEAQLFFCEQGLYFYKYHQVLAYRQQPNVS